MYHCFHALSEGSLVTFPEFGTANGRVDFYIPAKSWGIELLRDGNQLEKHCGRFSATGSYGTTLPLSDYIIVDCRTTRPRDKHQCKQACSLVVAPLIQMCALLRFVKIVPCCIRGRVPECIYSG